MTTTDNTLREQIDDLLPVNNIDSMTRMAILSLMTEFTASQIQLAENEGHFFVKKEMKGGAIDYGYYWYCKCGYKAAGKDELDGHIKWKLQAQKAVLEET